MGRRGRPIDIDVTLAWLLWATLLAWMSLRWGGTLPTERLALHIGAALLGVVAGFHLLRRPPGLPRPPRSAWVGLVAFFSLVLFTLLPLPLSLLRWIAPTTARWWGLAHPEPFRSMLGEVPSGEAVRSLLPPSLWHFSRRPLSIWPEGTWHDLMDWAACGVVLWVVAYLWHRRSVVGGTLAVIIGLAVFQAAYGLFGYWTGSLPWPAAERAATDRATGSFYNANHYVDFLGLSLPPAVAVWLGWWFELRRRMPRNFWGRVRVALNTANGLFPVLTLAILLIILGIGFSRSRGGISASLLVLAWMTLRPPPNGRPSRRVVGDSSHESPRSSGRRWVRPLVVLMMLSVVLVLWVGPEPILERFALVPKELELKPGRRLHVWLDTVRLIRQFPWWGTGLNTFGEAFYRVQSFYSAGRWGYAHNEWLQLVSDTGLVGALLFGLWIVALARWFRSTTLTSRRLVLWDWGCRMGVTYFVLDSLVDLNWRIPANVFLAVTLVGLRMAMRRVGPMPSGESDGLRRDLPVDSADRRVPSWAGYLRAAGGTALAVLSVLQAVRLYGAERLEEAYRSALNRRECLRPEALVAPASDLLRRPAGTSQLYRYIGICLSMAGIESPGWESETAGSPTLTVAMAAYVRASIENPSDYISRSNLAEILWQVGAPSRWPERLWRDSLAILPSEAPVWYRLGLFYWVWGRIDEALDAFRQAAVWDPAWAPRVYPHLARLKRPELLISVTPPAARVPLAEFLTRQEFLEAARQVLREVLKAGDEAEVWRALPLVATHPELGLASAFLERLRADRRREPERIYWELVWRLRARRYEDLEAVVQQALAAGDRTYGARSRSNLAYRDRLARRLAEAGFQETARALWTQITLWDAAYGEAYRGLGELALRQGNLQEAFAWFQYAPEDEATRRALFHIGQTALYNGQDTLAQQVFTFMTGRWTYRGYGYYGLALVAERGGRGWEALEAARQAQAARPEDVDVALLTARWEAQVGDRERARELWEAVLRRDPRRVEAYEGLIRYYREQGMGHLVRELCARAQSSGVTLAGCPPGGG